MFGRIVKKVTRQSAANTLQVGGAVGIAVGVLVLAGLGWALIAGGVLAVAAGVAAEVS